MAVKCPNRRNEGLEWLRSRGILVYSSILHNNLKVLGGIGDQVDILQRIPVDQQQIGKRAYELYEEHGRKTGHAAEDWEQAEHDIREMTHKPVKAEPEPEAKAKPKPEVKPGAKAEPEAEAKPEAKNK